MAIRLAQNLAGAGHDVSLLTRIPTTVSALPPSTYVIREGLGEKDWITSHYPVDLVACWSARRILARLRPQVVHIHGKTLYYPTLLAARALGIPTAFTVVDQYLFCPNQTLIHSHDGVCQDKQGAACASCVDFSRYLKNRLVTKGAQCLRLPALLMALRACLMRWSARSLSAVIALTETSRQRVLALGCAPQQVHRIYEYDVEYEPTEDASPPFDIPTVVYVGALTESRGAHMAILAMQHVLRAVPGARLLMIGEVWDGFGERVKRLPAELGIQDHVEWCGQMSNEEVLQTLRRSHVVIVPLQFPNEFGPMNMLEARYVGKPVVASRIGATHEFVSDGIDGFLVPPGSSEAFAEKISLLLLNPEMRQKIGEAARRASAFLRLGSYIPALETVYLDLTRAQR